MISPTVGNRDIKTQDQSCLFSHSRPAATEQLTSIVMWERYPKIRKGSVGEEVDIVEGEWVVTEKLHGANFSVIVQEDDVGFAKRSGVLETADNFYGFRTEGIDKELEEKARRLWQTIHCEVDGSRENLASLVVYGELLGGHYPHDKVPAVPDLRPVQCGVWYTPSLHFVAFDVAAISTKGASRFLDFQAAKSACEAAGFDFVSPMYVGSYTQCIHSNVRFQSTLPNKLSLPPLDAENFAEGIVVRPAREPLGARTRGLVKLKIPEFEETQAYAHAQWREARKGHTQPSSDAYRMRAEEDLLMYEMLAAVTPQRLANVVSKRGRVDVRDQGACRSLLSEFVQDVLESLVEDKVVPAVDGISKALVDEVRMRAREVTLEFLRGEVAASSRVRGKANGP